MRKETKIYPIDTSHQSILFTANKHSYQKATIPIYDIKLCQNLDSSASIPMEQRLNSKSLICQICNVEMKAKMFFRVSNCQHYYCIGCLTKYVEQMIEQYRQIKCCDESCEEGIECKQELGYVYSRLTKQNKDRLLKIMETFKELRVRKCKGCLIGELVFLTEEKTDLKRLYCPNCKVYTCIQCLDIIHPGQQCSKTRRRLPNGYQQCLKCHCIIQRFKGCIHIKCICGYNFCYECGQEWMDGHMCVKDLRHRRQGVQFLVCAIIKLIFLPIFALLFVMYLVIFSVMLCLLSGMLLGCVTWLWIIEYTNCQAQDSIDVKCLKFCVLCLMMILFPILQIILILPGLFIPILNIWYDKQITTGSHAIRQLFRVATSNLIQYYYC